MLDVYFIIGIIIVTLSVERTMRVFFEKRRFPILVTVLSYVFLCITIMLSGWLFVILYFIALLIVSLNYEPINIKCLAAVGGSHYIILTLTNIVNLIETRFAIPWLIDNEGMIVLFASIFIYCVTLAIFPLFKHIKKLAVNLNILWIPLIIFPISYTLIGLFYNINSTIVYVGANMLYYLGTPLMVFFLYNIISKVFNDTLKSALHAQEKEYYFSQCELMQESMEKVKSIQHDMKTHLTMLKDYTTDNGAATDYLNSLLGDIEESELYSDTGNIAFDSIINFKLKNAKDDNIKLDISVAVPRVMNIEVPDVVAVLGNLLDNALEAVSKVDDKMIKLDIEFVKGGLFIKADNSFSGEVRYLDEKSGDSTHIVTTKSGNGHGYGLKNIRQSVERYNGYLKINHTDTIFSAGVLLYVDEL